VLNTRRITKPGKWLLLIFFMGTTLSPSFNLLDTPQNVRSLTDYETDSTTQAWTTYFDKEWRFSVDVPSVVAEKKLLFIKNHNSIPVGPDVFLLLSNSSLSTTQVIGSDELTRVTIFRGKPDQKKSFDLWAVLMSAFAGTGTLSESSNGSCFEILMKVDKPTKPYTWSSAKWVDGKKYYFGILVQGIGKRPQEVDQIIESFQLEDCT
jgi:hypothetical protein